jgi:hypothetical protein
MNAVNSGQATFKTVENDRENLQSRQGTRGSMRARVNNTFDLAAPKTTNGHMPKTMKSNNKWRGNTI